MSNASSGSFHHEIILPASPQRVYALLTCSAEFAAVTGKAATIGAEGETFALFDGHIVGRQIELAPAERIVQAWRFPEWEPGAYTVVRFALTSDGEGTRLVVDQKGVPDGASPLFPTWQAHVEAGWPMFYFGPMTKHFGE